MTFTMKAAGTQEAQEVEIAAGSHVYVSNGEQYREWADLTPQQQKALVEIQKLLNDCFSQSMAASEAVIEEQGPSEAAA